jgi:hypothetical protein
MGDTDDSNYDDLIEMIIQDAFSLEKGGGPSNDASYAEAFRERLRSPEGLKVLQRAFTGETYDADDNYETIEFLGDRVMSAHLAEILYNSNFPITQQLLTELNASVTSMFGQVEMFKDYQLGRYLRESPALKIDGSNISIAKNGDLVESLFGALLIIGDMIQPGFGYLVTRNILVARLPKLSNFRQDRSLGSLISLITQALGKHAYLEKKGEDDYKRFITDESNGYTLTMRQISAEELNDSGGIGDPDRAIQPIVESISPDTLKVLSEETFEGQGYDPKSDAWGQLVDYLNDSGFDRDWRTLYQRHRELNRLLIEADPEDEEYVSAINELLQSRAFPYIRPIDKLSGPGKYCYSVKYYLDAPREPQVQYYSRRSSGARAVRDVLLMFYRSNLWKVDTSKSS